MTDLECVESQPPKKEGFNRTQWTKEYRRKRKAEDPNYRNDIERKTRERTKHLYNTDPEFKNKYKAQTKAWADSHRLEKREYDLIKKYNITMAQHNLLLEHQGGKCPICGYSDTSNRIVFPIVDHCHKNNVVRGLLCSSCNRGLGMFKDRPDLLQKAAEYVSSGGIYHQIAEVQPCEVR